MKIKPGFYYASSATIPFRPAWSHDKDPKHSHNMKRKSCKAGFVCTCSESMWWARLMTNGRIIMPDLRRDC